MKTAILFAAALLAGGATDAQSPPPLSVSSISEAPGKTKAQVCRAARDWVAASFVDSKAVIEVFDPDAGTIIGKGRVVMHGYAYTPFNVGFTMKIDCRDGKVRATFDGFTMHTQGHTLPLREDSLNKLQTKTEAHIKGMSARMVEQINSHADDDF